MGTVHVLYFARCREVTGCSSESLSVSLPCTVRELVEQLVERHPGLRTVAPTSRLAVNAEFAKSGALVHDGDEVALIPPVSGGVSSYQIRDDPFAHDAAVSLLSDGFGRAGGLATFVGIVRQSSQGKEIVSLDYEAYERMAVEKMTEIGDEAKAKWEIDRVAIVHRTGHLAVGDVAVSIAVLAAHRAPALEACRYVIDRLKEDVPIWKKETATDGTSWWGKGP